MSKANQQQENLPDGVSARATEQYGAARPRQVRRDGETRGSKKNRFGANMHPMSHQEHHAEKRTAATEYDRTKQKRQQTAKRAYQAAKRRLQTLAERGLLILVRTLEI